jgi:hypothetical protein
MIGLLVELGKLVELVPLVGLVGLVETPALGGVVHCADFQPRRPILAGDAGARAAGAQRESSNAAASLLEELFVGGMVTNPKPCSRVSFEETQGPVTQSDPEGPNVGLGLDTFKFERWMEGIFFPDLKSFLGCLPCRIRQLAVGFPE